MWNFRVATLTAAVSLCSPAFATSGSQYVTAQDLQFREDADTAADLWCSSWEGGGVSEEEGRDALEAGAGGENLILQALQESEDPNEVGTKLTEKMNGNTNLYMIGFPIIASIFLWIIWLVMCCTACPCRKLGCCRCCKRDWQCNKVMKGIALGCLILIFIGLVIALSMAYQGTAATSASISGLACSAARLVNSSYAGGGSGNTAFIGMLPTLEVFDELDGKLDDNSPFVTEVENLIDSTRDIDNAVMVASSTLKLLKDMLEIAGNAQPSMSSGDSLYHDNLLSNSNGLPALLTPAIDALDNGVATALSGARAAAAEQLNTENRQEIQSQLRNAIDPLVDAKNTLRTTFSGVVDPEIHESEGSANMALFGLVLGLFLWAFLAIFCGCGAIGCCFKGDDQPNSVHRMACCEWCCNFYLAIVALEVAGIMLILAVPISSVCLVLVDVDRPMLDSIAPAINFNMSGDTGIMMGDMVERCFNPPDASVPASLMDILFERNATSGQKVTLRDRFIDEFKAEIDTQFNAVTDRLSMDLPSLSQDIRIQALIAALANNPVNQMMLPQASLLSNSDYSALANVPSLSEAAMNSSASCTSFYSVLLSQGVGGIDAFSTELQAIGSSPTDISSDSLSCTLTVDCTGSSDAAACAAGNNLMNLKANLQGQASGSAAYRCDLFQPNLCDVKNMPSSNPSNAQMCLQSSGGSFTMTQQSTTCNLAGYTTYISEFSTRLQKVFENVDTVTATTMTAINVTLRASLDEHIMNPLDNMANSMNCNFMGELYGDLVDSFCYQGMWGFRRIAVSYTTLGFFQVLLIPLMYTVYRIGRDKMDSPEELESI